MTREQYESARDRFRQLAPGWSAKINETDFLPERRPPYRYLSMVVCPEGDPALLAADLVRLAIETEAGLSAQVFHGVVTYHLAVSRELAAAEVIAAEAEAGKVHDTGGRFTASPVLP